MTPFNLENLMEEIRYTDILHQQKSLDTLSLEELRAVLAYEMHSDGMEWPDVEETWQGRNPAYNTREQILETLVNCFGY